MASLSSINILFRADLSQFSSEMQNVSRKLNRQGQELQNLGKSLSLSLSVPLAALGVASIKSFGDLERITRGLEAVMGSSEAAAKEFELLKEVAKLPGLGLEEAVRGSVNLQAAGFSAEQARKTLLAFGNALATVGKGAPQLDLVNLALTQLNNKSSGFGQDLRQLTEQLPQLRGALKDAFGTSDTAAISKLGITGAEVVRRLTAEFEKLPKMTGGINNAFENLRDGIQISLAKIGNEINEAFNLEEIISSIGDAASSIAENFKALSPEIKRVILVFAGIATVIGPALLAIGTLVKLLPAIASGFTLMTGPIGLAVIGVGALIALIVANWDDVKKALIDTANYFIDLYNESILFRIGVENVILTFKTLNNTAVFVFEALKVGFKGLVSGIKIAVGIIGELISAVLTGRITSLPSIFAEGMKKLVLQQSKSLQQSREVFSKFGKNVGADFAKAAQNIIGRKKINILSENVNTTGLETKLEDAVVNGIGKGMKRIKLEDLAAPESRGTSGKTLASYDEEIAKITEFIRAVATTPVQIANAKKAIEKLEFQKTLLADPTSLINVEGFDIRLKSMASSYRSFSDEMVEIGEIIFESVEQFKFNVASGFGELLANAVTGSEGISGIFQGLILIVADFMVQLGKSLIAVGIASAAFKKAFANPTVALAAGIALVALGSIFKNQFQQGPQAFANGGIVGGTSTYGDKILARVNSKELILNQKQQKSLYGMINPAVSEGNMIANLVGQLTVKGNDLVLVMDRANKAKNRKG